METVKMVFTPEVKAKLQGLYGFNVETPFPYTPKVFRDALPKEQWPIFVLRSKSGTDIAKAEDNAGCWEHFTREGIEVSRFYPMTGSQRLNTLTKGLLRVKRFPLENGDLLEYDRKSNMLTVAGNKLDGDVIDFLPVSIQRELQNAINERSTMTPEELQGLIF